MTDRENQPTEIEIAAKKFGYLSAGALLSNVLYGYPTQKRLWWLAARALRAEEEREKGCVFCGEERHRIREIFDDGTARILCSMNRYALSVETPADATSECIFLIDFCPMCGRKLDGGGQA